MKNLRPVLAVSLMFVGICNAQHLPALLGDPPDGSAAPIVKPRVVALKPAEILESTVEHQGGRKIIVQHLALDPNHPILPVVPKKIPATLSSIFPESVREDAAASYHLLLLSATVYPGPATYLRWTYIFPDGGAKEYSGWSNIDFNHISGIGSFLGTDGAEHSFIMGIGTEQEESPDAPEFPNDLPTFLSDRGEIPVEALIAVDSLHKIYAVEKEKLAAAHAGRERAAAVRHAELLANPPQPKDLLIRYRIAETPLPNLPNP